MAKNSWVIILPLAFTLAWMIARLDAGSIADFGPAVFLFLGLALRQFFVPEFPRSGRGWLLDLSVPTGSLLFFLALNEFGVYSPQPARNWWADLLLIALPEEVFFRFGVQGLLLVRTKRPVLAILAASLVFAAFHAPLATDPIFLLRVFLGGLTFGILYHWRQSLVAPVAMHALLNQMT